MEIPNFRHTATHQETSKKEHELSPEQLANVKSIYVLFHGEPSGNLSIEAKMRSLAALTVAQLGDFQATIYCVGGGVGDKHGISGARAMQDYIIRKMPPEFQGKVVSIDRSNESAGNLREIQETFSPSDSSLQGSTPTESAVIISSSYHLPRLREILKNHSLNLEALPAEELLNRRNKHYSQLTDRYQNSPLYSSKELLEKLLLLYIKADPDQKLAQTFRTWKRG